MNLKSKHVIFIIGSIAVGKMTVGQTTAKKLNYDLLHNHHSIESALRYFGYGETGFRKINEGIRQLVFETIAHDQQKRGFIFTYVWAFDEQSDWSYIENIDALFTKNGWTTYYVELIASLPIRIQRNKTSNRLMHKPSKRDLVKSEESLLNLEKEHRLVSHPGELTMDRYFRVHNDQLMPDEVADLIISHFKLHKI